MLGLLLLLIALVCCEQPHKLYSVYYTDGACSDWSWITSTSFWETSDCSPSKYGESTYFQSIFYEELDDGVPKAYLVTYQPGDSGCLGRASVVTDVLPTVCTSVNQTANRMWNMGAVDWTPPTESMTHFEMYTDEECKDPTKYLFTMFINPGKCWYGGDSSDSKNMKSKNVDIESLIVKCSEDGNTATIYSYSDSNCQNQAEVTTVALGQCVDTLSTGGDKTYVKMPSKCSS